MLCKAFPAGPTLAALAFSGCLTGGGSGQNPPLPSGKPETTLPYVVQGDRIISLTNADTSYGCHGDTLSSRIEINPADTVRFDLNQDTLTLVLSTYTAQSGGVMERIQRLARTGGLGGLEGTWRYLGQDNRLVSGNLTAEEKAQFDDDLAGARFSDSFKDVVYVIDSGFIRIYEDEMTAERALARWNGNDPGAGKTADSAKYDMDLRIVDQYTVEYRGLRTSETVRVTEMPNGDLDFVSLDPGHPPAHVRTHPTSCPQEIIPAWYIDFLTQNRKPSVP